MMQKSWGVNVQHFKGDTHKHWDTRDKDVNIGDIPLYHIWFLMRVGMIFKSIFAKYS